MFISKKNQTKQAEQPRRTPLTNLRRFTRSSVHTTSFLIFLSVYLIRASVSWLCRFPLIPRLVARLIQWPADSVYRLLLKTQRRQEATINRFNLIELALKNMAYKRNRTIITVGGMAVGIGAIVFLVSIGYGLQRLVVSRVARLDEMRQTDISTQPGSQKKLDDASVAAFYDLLNVESVLPQIAVVARIEYANSVSDMAVYGVTSEYLQRSAIKPVQGTIFESNELAVSVDRPQIAGIMTESIKQVSDIGHVSFWLEPSQWVLVRDYPDRGGRIIGYTRATAVVQSGTEVWGGVYADEEFGAVPIDPGGELAGRWIESEVKLWEESNCSLAPESDCEDGYMPVIDSSGNQVSARGFMTRTQVLIEGNQMAFIDDRALTGLVLGETDIAEDISVDDLDWVDLASESGVVAQVETRKVDLAETARKEAVVNRAMLQVLGISEDQAVGQEFNVSYVVTSDLIAEDDKLESYPTPYRIVGVVPEDSVPFFYVPFIDLRGLGISNYSQIKIISQTDEALGQIRQYIENMGFATASVADTVAQIDRIFSTARTVLALVGMVALGVAALGMFNTLTVSLLERTREVGLMKAMGMRSHEVRELFLTESMIMGFLGGLLGVAIGWGSGKAVGLILTLIGTRAGIGFIDISHVPFSFVLVVSFLSILVGVVTGIYPAHRATKISALDALRYE